MSRSFWSWMTIKQAICWSFVLNFSHISLNELWIIAIDGIFFQDYSTWRTRRRHLCWRMKTIRYRHCSFSRTDEILYSIFNLKHILTLSSRSWKRRILNWRRSSKDFTARLISMKVNHRRTWNLWLISYLTFIYDKISSDNSMRWWRIYVNLKTSIRFTFDDLIVELNVNPRRFDAFLIIVNGIHSLRLRDLHYKEVIRNVIFLRKWNSRKAMNNKWDLFCGGYEIMLSIRFWMSSTSEIYLSMIFHGLMSDECRQDC